MWRHENTRVFADKLARIVDKDFVDKCVQEFATGHFGEELAEKTKALGELWSDGTRLKLVGVLDYDRYSQGEFRICEVV